MSGEEIIERIKAYDHTRIKYAVVDIDGVLRGKYLHKMKFLQGLENGLGFCDVIFGWDAADTAYTNGRVTGWHSGYPDAQLRIDLTTFRQIPWEDHIPFFLGDFSHQEGDIAAVCPRTLLKTIETQCVDMGYLPLFTQEFEWFNFKETPSQLAEKDFQHRQSATPGMFGYSVLRASLNSAYFHDLFDGMEAFRVPLEGLHTETGPGVIEACTQPHDVLEAADQAVLFKNGAKEIAYRHGIMSSFMAKADASLPGCSGHIHQSLWQADQKMNLFVDAGAPHKMSVLMQQYTAGQLACLPYIMPMLAPTINSYKRLVEGAWAPTTVTWGLDNRTAALRVLNVTPKLTRLETRVPGADTNPYLAMAACLAAGLYGIKHQLSLDQIPPVTGNGYQRTDQGRLPATLAEATNLMKNAEIPRELFGDAFVDHFVCTREWEWLQFSQQVTDWEQRRYFEII